MSEIKDFELEINAEGKAVDELPTDPFSNEEAAEDGVELSMDEMDEIAGGLKATINYYVNRYCPYCKKKHGKIAKCKENFVYKKKKFPLYWCSSRKLYFFTATNGCFDTSGNKIDTSK